MRGDTVLIRKIFSILCVLFFSYSFVIVGQEKSNFTSEPSAPSVNIPLYHFSYDFIEKLETKNVIAPSIALRNKPYTRNTVLMIIIELDEKLAADPNVLSRSEREYFQKLKGEFHFELTQMGKTFPSDETEKHIIDFEPDNSGALSYLLGDAIIEQALDISRYGGQEDTLNETVSFTRASGRVRGVLKNSIAFYSDFSSTLIKGSDKTYSFGESSQGGVINYNPSSDNVYSLSANAYLVIEPKWFRIQFGKDPIIIGPGKHSNLFLSENAGAFDNLRLDVTFDRLKFTYLHGWLRSKPLVYDGAGDLSDRKYIVAHRLEWKALPWLFLAGNESVIYGGRDMEIQYLNPIIPYHISEQYLGDKDNNTMSFDATAFVLQNVKTYAALYLDDFTTARNPFTYWKQTWAVMAGVYWVEPFQVEDTDFRFEYSRIEPYVYAHKYSLINYAHFRSSLGSSLPPNSDDYFFEIRYRPLRKLFFGLNYELLRHGKGNIEVFGYADGFVDAGTPGKQKKKFLQGINETSNIVSAQFQWETFRQQYLYLTAQWKRINGFENIRNRTA
ncbi:hypothetical protein JNM05_14520, partial [bacterium]|nr:hypothetical protein [bacterium]